jgi:hypothetical protein
MIRTTPRSCCNRLNRVGMHHDGTSCGGCFVRVVFGIGWSVECIGVSIRIPCSTGNASTIGIVVVDPDYQHPAEHPLFSMVYEHGQ